jgi:thiamine-phosphate pyrophosphorylase
MLAAEQGADYVMFGEPDESGARPGFNAIEERVAWWAEVFEAPCVAYAAAPGEVRPFVTAGADFVALGDWLWRDAAAMPAAIAQAIDHLRLPETAA